jgi:hypothetical protein
LKIHGAILKFAVSLRDFFYIFSSFLLLNVITTIAKRGIVITAVLINIIIAEPIIIITVDHFDVVIVTPVTIVTTKIDIITTTKFMRIIAVTIIVAIEVIIIITATTKHSDHVLH